MQNISNEPSIVLPVTRQRMLVSRAQKLTNVLMEVTTVMPKRLVRILHQVVLHVHVTKVMLVMVILAVMDVPKSMNVLLGYMTVINSLNV